MKRILVNATHAEEIRVAMCDGNHLYNFDLENRTREQKKANIYKGHVTRVEPSLEAVFVEYGSERQGFLSMREIAREYLKGDPRSTNNIRDLISEGTELLVQVEKEERGNKGAALSTYISLAGRYLVLMPNNASGGGVSRQISGNVRDEMKRMLGKLNLPKSMSVIVRTAGIGRSQEDLQNDLNHLLSIWQKINDTANSTASPCLAHQEAGVVTRAVRDYLRDDIAEVWLDNEQAYNEAYNFVSAVMPHQVQKLRKYMDIEPMFARFGVENQIETAYMREVKLPSGGSIVIDQTEALVSIDINSAKATKGADVEATAYNTNLEAADEIARQLRLRDMGGLIVIDFIDMNEDKHQRNVEQRLRDATQPDRARIQFAQISRFGLMEMSRQRLRPSLEEATGYVCPRCHGTGMIRDLRSLSLSIMRNIEEIALREGQGEVQAEVPIEIGAFLLNEKRDSLVYLEQDSGARITILPHAHLDTPHYKIHFNRNGYAPSSYERVSDTHVQETQGLGYDTNWQTDRPTPDKQAKQKQQKNQRKGKANKTRKTNNAQATAWLSNLFEPSKQANTSDHVSTQDAATAIEEIVNDGGVSRGASGQLNQQTHTQSNRQKSRTDERTSEDKNNKRRKPRDDKRKRKSKSSDDTAQQQHNKADLPRRDASSRRPSRGTRNRNVDLETVAATQSDAAQTKDAARPVNPDEVNVNIIKSEAASLTDAQVVNIDLASDTVTKTPVEKKPRRRAGRDTHEQTATQQRTAQQTAATPSEQSSEMTDQSGTSSSRSEVGSTTSNASTAATSEKTASHAINPLIRWEGRAKNDPRDAGKTLAITGSVLSFTQAALGDDAEQAIAEDGLVTAFIQALNQANTSQGSTLQATPLAADVIAAYRDSIGSSDHSTADAGTADVAMPSPAYRASNDPRGRIAGFDTVPAQLCVLTTDERTSSTAEAETDTAQTEPPSVADAAGEPNQVATHTDAEQETDDAAVAAKPTPAETAAASNAETSDQGTVAVTAAITPAQLKGLTLASFIKQQLGDSAQQMLDEGDLIAAFLQALKQDTPQATSGETQATGTATPKKKPAKKASTRTKTKRTSRKVANAEVSRPEKKPAAADSSDANNSDANSTDLAEDATAKARDGSEPAESPAPKPKRRGRPPKKKPAEDAEADSPEQDEPAKDS